MTAEDRKAMLKRMAKMRHSRVDTSKGVTLVCPVHGDRKVTLYISTREAWCQCGKRLVELKEAQS